MDTEIHVPIEFYAGSQFIQGPLSHKNEEEAATLGISRVIGAHMQEVRVKSLNDAHTQKGGQVKADKDSGLPRENKYHMARSMEDLMNKCISLYFHT